MVAIPDPRPGTVAAGEPMPELVNLAVRLIGGGAEPTEAADRLAAGANANDLRAAQLWWVRRMPKDDWDDHEAGAVLRALERALALTNSKVPDRIADRERRTRRR